MMSLKRYDLIVIGTGAAASSVAPTCRKAGWTVAVIDSRPFGGTCALRGCDPKKVLVGAAEAIHWGHRLNGRGIQPGGARIEWADLMAFKRTFTEPVPEGQEQWLRELGIDTFHGRAKFTSATTLRVAGDDPEAKHVVIASGAMPATLGIAGEEHLTTSTQFLELDELPERVVFVGGGYISMEFANVAVRAGANVTVLHRGPRPLAGFDPDLADKAAQAARDSGIDLRLETRVHRVGKTADGFAVDASSAGVSHTFAADLVVHGAGRVGEIDDLDLDAAGVERGERGVVVNEYLQSVSNPAVYAAGDAAETEGLPLTPVAGLEGRVVAANLLHGNTTRPNYSGTPTVAFTLPPIAAVGLTEQEARDRGLVFRVNAQDTSGWYSARRVGDTHGGSKVLIEEGTDRILGAHLFGSSADELINIFALAIRRGLTAEGLKDVVFAYPTHRIGRGVHGLNVSAWSVEQEATMKTLICSTCGCSLVRLGISKEQAVPHVHEGQQLHFCCQGCLDLFTAEPEKYLRLTEGVIVCPNCLGEKPPDRMATFIHAGQDVPYCRVSVLRRDVPAGPHFLHSAAGRHATG